MWHIVKVGHASKARNTRAHGGGRRQREFSHPVRFEPLEERVALNAAPTTPDTGAGAGTNPGNVSPGSTTGSSAVVTGNPLLNPPAFNTPSWIPNNRPPFASISPPTDELSLNVSQQASTPYGIRNFNFGPDTGTHFSTPGVMLPVHRLSNGNGSGNRAADGSLDNTLLVDAVLDAEMLGSPRREAASEVQPDDVPSGDYDGHARLEDAPAADSSAASAPDELVSSRLDGLAQPAHLEASAVDQMMAAQSEADRARADAAIVQVAADSPAESDPGVGPVAQALAVSLASVTSVPIREHFWDKDSRRGIRASRVARW